MDNSFRIPNLDKVTQACEAHLRQFVNSWRRIALGLSVMLSSPEVRLAEAGCGFGSIYPDGGCIDGFKIAATVDDDFDLEQAIALVLTAGELERVIGIGLSEVAGARDLRLSIGFKQLINLGSRHARVGVPALQGAGIT